MITMVTATLSLTLRVVGSSSNSSKSPRLPWAPHAAPHAAPHGAMVGDTRRPLGLGLGFGLEFFYVHTIRIVRKVLKQD